MVRSKNQRTSIRVFGSIKVLVACSLFVAMSIVLGKFLSVKIGDNIRISFENLSLLLSGILFGPLIGMLTAVVADVVGCFLYGYAINPIITMGAACIGFFAGAISCTLFKRHLILNVTVSVFVAHIIGSMIVKTIGLYIYYPNQRPMLPWRIPIYLITATVESALIFGLMKSRIFLREFEKFRKKHDKD